LTSWGLERSRLLPNSKIYINGETKSEWKTPYTIQLFEGIYTINLINENFKPVENFKRINVSPENKIIAIEYNFTK
jgi:hypothetical protein